MLGRLEDFWTLIKLAKVTSTMKEDSSQNRFEINLFLFSMHCLDVDIDMGSHCSYLLSVSQIRDKLNCLE